MFEPWDESYCHRCSGPNIVWSAPSPLWNKVMRGDDINGKEIFDGIVCPVCFAFLAQDAGVAFGWRMAAVDVCVELKTRTPSGRTWNQKEWMWA